MNSNIHINLRLPSNLKYLNVLGACLAAFLEHAHLSDSEGEIYNVQLAVHEICTNIIEHAYEGKEDKYLEIEICFNESQNLLTVTLNDTSSKIYQANKTASEDNEISERGRGLFLAEQLMDSVQYQRHAEFNEWILEKRFS